MHCFFFPSSFSLYTGNKVIIIFCSLASKLSDGESVHVLNEPSQPRHVYSLILWILGFNLHSHLENSKFYLFSRYHDPFEGIRIC